MAETGFEHRFGVEAGGFSRQKEEGPERNGRQASGVWLSLLSAEQSSLSSAWASRLPWCAFSSADPGASAVDVDFQHATGTGLENLVPERAFHLPALKLLPTHSVSPAMSLSLAHRHSRAS